MNHQDLPGNSIWSTVNTAVVGANFTALTGAKCLFVRIHAPAANAIDVQKGGAGPVITINAGQVKNFYGVDDPSTLGVRRNDQSATPVAVTYETLI